MSKALFWFRNDLRINDNPGLYQASKQHKLVLPVYIIDDSVVCGQASEWWLARSLVALNESLDGSLQVYVGKSDEIMHALVSAYMIDVVYWSRSYEPVQYQIEKRVMQTLNLLPVSCIVHQTALLFAPETIVKKDTNPYYVFTPFYNRCLAEVPLLSPPVSKPAVIPTMPVLAHKKGVLNPVCITDLIKPWHYEKEPNAAIGQHAAHKKIRLFIQHQLKDYPNNRDFPALSGCAMLSAHLHFGEMSARTIWFLVQEYASEYKEHRAAATQFLRQLIWREFCYYQLYYFPHLDTKPIKHNFDTFGWENSTAYLKAWQHGYTGYPLVDAGMRELWQTGFMHNRVRMVAASFLAKNLLIDWRHGAQWFLRYLCDADLACNSANWQWVAGCGLDAAPYFRIFNPTLQAKKFDPDAAYIKQYVPELKPLPHKYVATPWLAPEALQKSIDYPKPIIDLAYSRNKALALYKKL